MGDGIKLTLSNLLTSGRVLNYISDILEWKDPDEFIDKVKSLVDKSKIDANYYCGNPRVSFLVYSLYYGHPKISKYLIDNCPIPEDTQYLDMLLVGAVHGNLMEFVKFFIKKGSNINCGGYITDSLLHDAVFLIDGGCRINMEIIDFLVKQEDIDLNIKDSGGLTPVERAYLTASGGILSEIAQLLIRSGSNYDKILGMVEENSEEREHIENVILEISEDRVKYISEMN